MNKKKMDIKTALIAVLTVALLGVSGYLIYDKFFVKDEALVSDEGSRIDEKKDETPKVVYKEVCAPHEGICFKHPETWTSSVSEETSGIEPVKTDRAMIEATDGTRVSVVTGVMGIGSVCFPEEQGKVAVVRQKETGLTGYSTEHGRRATVSVAAIVTSNKEETEFRPMIGLTNSSELLDGTNDSACAAQLFGMFDGRGVEFSDTGDPSNPYGLVSVSTAQVIGGPEEEQTPKKVYSSLEEAKKAFETESYKQAFDIIASAYYK